MTTRKGERVLPASDPSVPAESETVAIEAGAAARPSVLARAVATLQAEASLVLAVLMIVLVRVIAGNPEIGPVGHFGPLTRLILVLIFGVVVFAAIGSTFDPLRVWSHIGAHR